jgi:hypothetical protein
LRLPSSSYRSFLFCSFGIIIWNFPVLAIAQFAVPDDLKHDTPGQVIKKGQSVNIDVDLALVNASVTDPYNHLVTGLEPDNFRVFETTSSRRFNISLLKTSPFPSASSSIQCGRASGTELALAPMATRARSFDQPEDQWKKKK